MGFGWQNHTWIYDSYLINFLLYEDKNSEIIVNET